MTPEDIEAEYWAYHFDGKAGASSEEFTDEDFDLEKVLAEIDAEAEAEAASAVGEPAIAQAGQDEPLNDLSQVDDWEDMPDA